MFNDEITLIAQNNTYNKAGDKQENRVETTVLCEVRSTTRNEYYNYGDNENRPEYVVTLNSCEYNGETEVMFNNRKYRVTRTYIVDRDTIELTLSRRIGR